MHVIKKMRGFRAPRHVASATIGRLFGQLKRGDRASDGRKWLCGVRGLWVRFDLFRIECPSKIEVLVVPMPNPEYRGLGVKYPVPTL